jgi:hypothetical protein
MKKWIEKAVDAAKNEANKKWMAVSNMINPPPDT